MEIKTPIFKRVPPGDRWIEVEYPDDIYGSLTLALEYYFQKTSIKQYYIDAGAGLVYKVEEQEEPQPEPQRTFSIYDE